MKKPVIVIPILVGLTLQISGCQKANNTSFPLDTQSIAEQSIISSEATTTAASIAITESSEEVSEPELELIIINANPVSLKCFDAEGNMTGTIENEYDVSGNKTKRTNRDKDGKVLSLHKFEYDNAGNLIKRADYDSNNNLIRHIVYEYDESGNQTKYTVYGTHDSILVVFEYNYDKSGKIVKETKKALDDINSWKNYEYDDQGFLKKVTTYSDDYSVRNWAEYENDTAGHVISINEYDRDGNISYEYKAEYDDIGNMIKEDETRYLFDKKIFESSELSYDDSGKLLSVTRYNPDGSIIDSIEYEY